MSKARISFTPMLIFIYLTPLKHPEKSAIFQGTRLIPLSYQGEGEVFV
jgi:hypothetical protein